jgi:hypothetical protein
VPEPKPPSEASAWRRLAEREGFEPPAAVETAIGPRRRSRGNASGQSCPGLRGCGLAKVAAAYPDLVSIAPKFEAHACADHIDGIHLGSGNAAVAKDIADCSGPIDPLGRDKRRSGEQLSRRV